MDDKTYTFDMEAPVIEPPKTVISLVPSVTESLFDLGLGSRLTAITDYCVRPAVETARLPHIGGTKNPDVGRIIGMNPDLVIANREENRKEDVLALQDAGIPVWVTFPRTVSDAINLLWNVMHVFDETRMVPRVRLIEQTMDWVLRIGEVQAAEKPCRVFVPIWLDPLMTFNANTYPHDVLRVCGATNVFGERERRFPLAADLGEAPAYPADDPRVQGQDTRYPRVSWDEVVVAQPDMVILPSEPFAFTDAHVRLFSRLDIPAAKNNRIILVDGSLLTWHGTRLAYALDTLPALFCPQEN
ncbi:MAG: ABC transporter substrate-binding protein [Anaerolineaceae bacterium]|nr:ABC transporter substrate-binding protein [Anaerolineaceae bacterium]